MKSLFTHVAVSAGACALALLGACARPDGASPPSSPSIAAAAPAAEPTASTTDLPGHGALQMTADVQPARSELVDALRLSKSW